MANNKLKKQNLQRAAHYDKDSDVLYLGLREGEEEGFMEVGPGVNLEMDEEGKILGIEILQASQVLGAVAQPNKISKENIKSSG